MERKKLNTRTIVMAAMLGAIASVLMFVEFSVPFAPPFVKFDLSDLPYRQYRTGLPIRLQAMPPGRRATASR